MEGGEIFVPRIPSMRVTDIAEAIAPDAERRIVGIRPGEKIHEVLLTSEEARHATAFEDHFAIYPRFPFWRDGRISARRGAAPGLRLLERHERRVAVSRAQFRRMADDLAPVS